MSEEFENQIFISTRAGDFVGIVAESAEQAFVLANPVKVFTTDLEKLLWTGEVRAFHFFPDELSFSVSAITYSTPFRHPLPKRDATPKSDVDQLLTDLNAGGGVY